MILSYHLKVFCTRVHFSDCPNFVIFFSQVYGETSFELICQILDKLNPIGSCERFVDLGSGVGQVVLQVAALTECKFSFGIEKAKTPARYSKVTRNKSFKINKKSWTVVSQVSGLCTSVWNDYLFSNDLWVEACD